MQCIVLLRRRLRRRLLLQGWKGSSGASSAVT
jgi:hypothetical protein